jgi:DNA-binding transcriptional MerR regulator
MAEIDMSDDENWERVCTHGMQQQEVRERLAFVFRLNSLHVALSAIRRILIEEGVEPDRAVVRASQLFENALARHLDELAPRIMADMKATADD